jgi:hypothetical protein
MFLVFLDIFYPPKFRCFEKNGVFQHPRLIATVTHRRGRLLGDLGARQAGAATVALMNYNSLGHT